MWEEEDGGWEQGGCVCKTEKGIGKELHVLLEHVNGKFTVMPLFLLKSLST